MIRHQTWIKFKQAAGQLVLRSKGFVLPSEIRRYRLNSGRSPSLYLFIRRAINRLQKLSKHVTFLSYILNYIQPLAVKVNFTCGGYYWGSPVRLLSSADNIFSTSKNFTNNANQPFGTGVLHLNFSTPCM
jgi:hypothetical protein